jgi:threonine dehydrogenase-like Zn-dependent dehydrogenase
MTRDVDVTALPETMPAAVYQAPGRVTIEERPVPVPGPGQVLIEIDHCGICGSDIHLIMEGWGKPGSVFGHESAGTIAAVGDGVEDWAPGDVVVIGSGLRCGHCRRCLEGKPSQCENRSGEIMDDLDGSFALYSICDAARLLRVPEGLSTRGAALAEPLAVALHGITRSGVAAGDSVMVFGAGPIGALTVATLVARGIGPICVIEPGPGRAALAKALGADEVIGPDDLETFDRFQPERIATRAAHVVLECSGKRSAMEAGFNQLRRGGTMALVGAGVDHPTFDPNRFLLNELTVCGSFVYDADGFARALELLASGDLPLDLLIDPVDVPLSGLGDALKDLMSGRIAGKALVAPGMPGAGA